LDGKYGGPYTFPLLAMFYPSLDFRHKLHQDHIHPRSHFTRAQLIKRGIPDELHDQFMDRIDLIPNLQLLEGQPNIEKSATPFAEWLVTCYPEAEKRADYLKRHFIPSNNYDLVDFLEFFAERRAQLLAALRQLVGVDDSTDAEGSEERRPDEEAAGFHADCMAVVGRHLGIPLSADSQTLYASGDRETRAVCVVSKRYVRGQQGDRYWYRFGPPQVEFLRDAKRGFVVFGCAGADLTVVIPSGDFVPTLAGMRQTQEDGGRSYWHVELFGDSHRLELAQSLLNSRIDVTKFIVSS
jgi:hypothetical protein